jgi:TolB protein
VKVTLLGIAGFLLVVTCVHPDGWERVVDEDPAWSPDGRQIVFTRSDSTGRGLYIVDSSGQDERLLLEGNWTSPAWSPDAEWLIFSVGYAGVIYRVKANGDSLTQLTFEGTCFFPDWSVHDRIAFDAIEDSPGGTYTLWLMDPDGSNRKSISEHGGGASRCPSWSPGGDKLVFCRGYSDAFPGWDLAAIDSSGGGYARLTEDSSDYRRPRWSPDGASVVVSRSVHNEWRLWILDLDTRQWLKLATPHRAFDPTWSPDGQHICFSLRQYRDLGWGMHETYARLWMIDRDGNNLKQLTRRH